MKLLLIYKNNIFKIQLQLFITMNIRINLLKFLRSKNHKFKIFIKEIRILTLTFKPKERIKILLTKLSQMNFYLTQERCLLILFFLIINSLDKFILSVVIVLIIFSNQIKSKISYNKKKLIIKKLINIIKQFKVITLITNNIQVATKFSI